MTEKKKAWILREVVKIQRRNYIFDILQIWRRQNCVKMSKCRLHFSHIHEFINFWMYFSLWSQDGNDFVIKFCISVQKCQICAK